MLLVDSNESLENDENTDDIVNNDYIINVENGTMRETKFWFKYPNDGFELNSQMIEYIYLGTFSVFYTYKHEAGGMLKTPVFYINNQTEKVEVRDTWEATCYVNFFVPGFENDTVIEGLYDNGDLKEILVTTKKIVDLREISLHSMLNLNQDFEDDLLFDAIELIY